MTTVANDLQVTTAQPNLQPNGDLHNSKGLSPFITSCYMLVILEWMFYHVVSLLLSTV